MENKKQLIFFYGAGAEAAFSMPIGVKYRENTILLSAEDKSHRGTVLL